MVGKIKTMGKAAKASIPRYEFSKARAIKSRDTVSKGTNDIKSDLDVTTTKHDEKDRILRTIISTDSDDHVALTTEIEVSHSSESTVVKPEVQETTSDDQMTATEDDEREKMNFTITTVTTDDRDPLTQRHVANNNQKSKNLPPLPPTSTARNLPPEIIVKTGTTTNSKNSSSCSMNNNSDCQSSCNFTPLLRETAVSDSISIDEDGTVELCIDSPSIAASFSWESTCSSSRRVHFHESVVVEVRERPRTEPEDSGTLFYTKEELESFYEEWDNDSESDDPANEIISLGSLDEEMNDNLYPLIQDIPPVVAS